ncbi:MAG: beta-propeller fold lactonase family protein [Acidobacteriota bacterium]
MKPFCLAVCALWFAAGPLTGGAVRIYVANSDDSKITVIDPASNTVVGEIAVSANPHGIVPSPDGKRFFVSSESKDVLDVVDRGTGQVIQSIPIGLRPNNVAITADGKRVYVCIRGKSQVDIIDTASLEKVKSVEVGKGPHNVYRTPDGKYMIATSMEGEKLTVIDVKTEEPAFTLAPGGVPRPVAIDANPDKTIRRLFVQLSNLHGFEVMDWASRKVTQKVMLPQAPPEARPLIPATFSHGMAIAPDHKTLWVDDMLNNTVNVFSMADLKPVAVIPVGRGPDWLVFTPDGKRCYVSNAGSNTVSAIDTASMKEMKQIPVGKVPKRIIAAE